MAAEIRDREPAEVLLRLLGPHADQVVAAAGMPFGSVSHFLALLAGVLGDHDRADAAFATAAATHARMAAPAFLANTQTEWARLLLTRGNPGDARARRRSPRPGPAHRPDPRPGQDRTRRGRSLGLSQGSVP